MVSCSELSLQQFSEDLFSRAPTPGGGCAAALTGALSVSLGAMAANLTVGKKKYASVEDRLRGAIASCDELRRRFLELIDEDAAAFEPLSRAYSLPKDAENYAARLREATLSASRPPLKMMRTCAECIELLEELSSCCSPLVISDVACGASLAGAALASAALNVFVNTRTLRGDAEADAMEEEGKRLLSVYRPRAEAIVLSVQNTLLEG